MHGWLLECFKSRVSSIVLKTRLIQESSVTLSVIPSQIGPTEPLAFTILASAALPGIGKTKPTSIHCCWAAAKVI